MKLSTVITALALSCALVAGCSKDKKDEASATTTSAQTGAAKKKLPGAASARSKQSGKKGGTGSSRPSTQSHKANAATANATTRRKQDGDNPCLELPDGVAECAGETLLVCDDKELWAIDCGALMTAAHPDLFSGGSCYETDTVTDCFGAGVADDGVAEACTGDLSLCCDEIGNCAFHG